MTGSNLKTSGEVEALELRLARSRTVGSPMDDRRLSVEENSMMTPSGPARTTQDALTFLKLVRDTFKDDDGKYKQLLQILKDFQTKTIGTGKLVSQVKTLFVAHPQLLLGMNEFLPVGYKISDPVENSHDSFEEGVEGSPLCTDGQQQQQQVTTGREEVEETLPPPGPAAPPMMIPPGCPPSSSPVDVVAATSPSPPLEKHALDLQRALSFVNKVKVRFHDERHLFLGFLEVLNLYREAGLETQDLVSKITVLFKGHRDLMDDFYGFLPACSLPPPHQLVSSKPSSHAQGRSSPSRPNRVSPQNRVHSKRAAAGGAAASKKADSSPRTATEDCRGREEVLENGTGSHSSPGQMKRHLRQAESEFDNFGPCSTPSLMPVTKRRRTSLGDQDCNDFGREALPEEAMDQSSLRNNTSQELPSSAPTLPKKPPCNKCQECLRRRGNAIGLDGRTDGEEGFVGTERRGSSCALPEQPPHEDCLPLPVSLEGTERDIDVVGERHGDQTVPKLSKRQVRGADDETEQVIAEVAQTPSTPELSQGIVKLNANEEVEGNDAGKSSFELQKHRQPKGRKQHQQLKSDGKATDHDHKADGEQDLETEQLNLLTSRKLPRSTPTKTAKTSGIVSNGNNPHHQNAKAELARKGEKSGGVCALTALVAPPVIDSQEADEENDRSSPTSHNTDSDESAREKLVYFRPKLGKREQQKEKIDKRHSDTGGTHGNNNSSNDSKEWGRKISSSQEESVIAQSSSTPREERRRRRRSPNKKTDKLERSNACVSRRLLHQENCSPKPKRRRRLGTEDDEIDHDTAHQGCKEEPLGGVLDQDIEPTFDGFSQNSALHSAKTKQGSQVEDLQYQNSRKQNPDGVTKEDDESSRRSSYDEQSPTGSKNGMQKCHLVDQKHGGPMHGDDDDKTDQSASNESEKENQKQAPLAANDSSQKVMQKRSSARLAHELLRKQCQTTERVGGQGGSQVVPSSAGLSGEDQKLLELRQLEEKKIMELQLMRRKALDDMKRFIERQYASPALLPKCLIEFSTQVLSCPELQTIVTQFQEDQELEYSQCRKATVSYYMLPKSYIKPVATCRTELDREVLNDEWVSAGYDSEGKDNSQDESGGCRKQIGREGTGKRTPHDKRLFHEERLFLCEDDQFELDLLRHTAASTIKRLEEMMEKTKAPDFCEESLNWDEYLTPVHVRCIERIYGDYGADLIEAARKRPLVALPVILGRLKQKEEVDWPDYQKEMNKTWAEVRAEHFHKSLIYKPNGKQSDKTLTSHDESFPDSQCDEDEQKCDDSTSAGEEKTQHPDAEIVYNIIKYLQKEMCMSGEQFNIFLALWSSHVGAGGPVAGEKAGGVVVSKIDRG